ncbi:hypothetical protein [Psychroflexus salis]|uniref:Uncharacterized protein n=1 Tax=Psychroflexus salis TaxID=1526574 RepID=A0A916ZWV6_9FLAO|nr:hypothetical protein [Psychroflexus salis]GGE17274.1 hypothetical protein GCM10010831_18180 [Psychroflexus salis]
MFSKILHSKGFLKSVLYLSIAFIVVYNLVDIGIKFNFDISLYIEQRFAKDNLLRFFVANIGSGFVYGFIVSFFKFKGKLKNTEEN